MDPAYFDYLLFAAGALAATTLGFAVAWLRARERAVRAESRLASGAERLGTGAAEARFDRLEQLTESVALELERVAEAQRFQAKLLAGRADQGGGDRPAVPARIITPH